MCSPALEKLLGFTPIPLDLVLRVPHRTSIFMRHSGAHGKLRSLHVTITGLYKMLPIFIFFYSRRMF